MRLRSRWAARLILIPVALLAPTACGGTNDSSAEVTQIPAPQASETPARPVLQMALASSDLSVGPNRVAFGLIDNQSGPLRDADVQVSTFFLGGDGQEGPIEMVKAVFRKWPLGPGGVYTAQLSFDRPGTWGLGVVASEADGTARPVSIRIEVREESLTPAIGSPSLRSVSKTSRDVASLEELTSDTDPDPDLYAMSVAEAIDSGKPLMVSFATPAYCQTAACGPQVDVIKGLKEQYRGRVNFIHVEVYDNPREIQGDLSRGRLSPTVTEWNLRSEPWTFIVDAEGLIASKFEGFATREELEAALAGVLP